MHMSLLKAFNSMTKCPTLCNLIVINEIIVNQVYIRASTNIPCNEKGTLILKMSNKNRTDSKEQTTQTFVEMKREKD